MSNPDVYPVTAQFERDGRAVLQDMDLDTTVEEAFVTRLYAGMSKAIGEYEHGTADVDEFFEKLLSLRAVIQQDADDDREVQRAMLKIYADVCIDILQTYIHDQ